MREEQRWTCVPVWEMTLCQRHLDSVWNAVNSVWQLCLPGKQEASLANRQFSSSTRNLPHNADFRISLMSERGWSVFVLEAGSGFPDMLHLMAGFRFISIFVPVFSTDLSPTTPEFWVLQRKGLLLWGLDQTGGETNHASIATISVNRHHNSNNPILHFKQEITSRSL